MSTDMLILAIILGSLAITIIGVIILGAIIVISAKVEGDVKVRVIREASDSLLDIVGELSNTDLPNKISQIIEEGLK